MSFFRLLRRAALRPNPTIQRSKKFTIVKGRGELFRSPLKKNRKSAFSQLPTPWPCTGGGHLNTWAIVICVVQSCLLAIDNVSPPHVLPSVPFSVTVRIEKVIAKHVPRGVHDVGCCTTWSATVTANDIEAEVVAYVSVRPQTTTTYNCAISPSVLTVPHQCKPCRFKNAREHVTNCGRTKIVDSCRNNLCS